MSNIVDLVKKAALEAMEASKPVNLLFGTVVSASPLKIQVDPQTVYPAALLILTRNVTDFELDMTVNYKTEKEAGGSGMAAFSSHSHDVLGRKTFRIHNALQVGETVLLLRVQGGKRLIVLDRLKGVSG